jgi:glycosyltransferase involved in cell wall biosynthesis
VAAKVGFLFFLLACQISFFFTLLKTIFCLISLKMNRLIFVVTNELAYDQRMDRICSSLTRAGYVVQLVGRKTRSSPPLAAKVFQQTRLPVFFSAGKSFYVEYNFKLFFYLLFKKADLITAIDLDTILPVYIISRIKRIKRAYDAHELFTEMKEVISRPFIHRLWKNVERFAVPRFPNGYTVSDSISDEFKTEYGVQYLTIRNVPLLGASVDEYPRQRILVYTGAVNEGRGFEALIPAMKTINAPLHIYGDGNFMSQCRDLIAEYHLDNKVILKNKMNPSLLSKVCREAWIGINLVEPFGKNQLFSLANKFFDYMHAELPQISMDFPEYRKVNREYEIAVLVKTLDEKEISESINRLLDDEDAYDRLKENCKKAKHVFNWQEEEQNLLRFHHRLLA